MPNSVRSHTTAAVVAGLALALAGPAGAATGGAAPAALAPQGGTGGMAVGAPAPQSTRDRPVVPGTRARLIRGIAFAPEAAPLAVKRAIWAGNKLQNKPYIYGGGHASFALDRGYDCSGTVSFVIHAAGLLPYSYPVDATGFFRWGRPGRGEWITTYANGSHAYVVLAGLRLDTSGNGGHGPRWNPEPRDASSFIARHPAGY